MQSQVRESYGVQLCLKVSLEMYRQIKVIFYQQRAYIDSESSVIKSALLALRHSAALSGTES